MSQLEQEILQVLNQIVPTIEKAFIDVFVMRHPGHANQKVHGNRYGAGQAKESLRRLKDDKAARERYKTTARGKRDTGEVLEQISQPAGAGFSPHYASFEDYVKSEREIFGEDHVKRTKGKRGELVETGSTSYIKLGDRILSASSGFYTKKLFEKIQSDKGFNEFLSSKRQLAKDLKDLRSRR